MCDSAMTELIVQVAILEWVRGQAAERFVVLVGFTKAARQGNATSHIVPVRGLFSLRV